ncbi:hypothetical protein Dimus_037343, partial [Dionaea muscipula]
PTCLPRLMRSQSPLQSILPAFASMGLNLLGKVVHGLQLRRGFDHNVVVETSIVDMYCKFGLLLWCLEVV